ncbi:hypothetical protein EYF80_018014 [Liparis tanakae]|uniref:Uncharacterized protein n=1 Tax=Liparis tanakae TaxID=230148 RepID=A0A4Z2I346_9TELE|nr:hypothetical protein EYF80_018014 [Liparis tanakae]
MKPKTPESQEGPQRVQHSLQESAGLRGTGQNRALRSLRCLVTGGSSGGTCVAGAASWSVSGAAILFDPVFSCPVSVPALVEGRRSPEASQRGLRRPLYGDLCTATFVSHGELQESFTATPSRTAAVL